MDKIRSLEEKITGAIEKVKALKEENGLLSRRLRELEGVIRQRDEEIARLTAERDSIRAQVEELLGELETLEI